MGKNQLEQLREITKVVADTGDLEMIAKYKPIDATTNPSLIYAAAQKKEQAHLVTAACQRAKQWCLYPNDLPIAMVEWLLATFAAEVLKIVPGRVSIEVDASLSFNADQSVAAARRIYNYLSHLKADHSRVLIKLAATWEGIKAARILEKEGKPCNVTLIFSLAQAMAAGEARATLISPFVGRILDWYANKNKDIQYTPENDPGVLSVGEIYKYYKQHGINTLVMGASFRSVGEIRALAGCDLLTIAPKFLEELEKSNDPLPRVLSPAQAAPNGIIGAPETLTHSEFMFRVNENAMAAEKLSEGIRQFCADQRKLIELLKTMN
jgi:transaldolase